MIAEEFSDVVAQEFAGYDDDGLRELIERVAQIAETRSTPGWPLFRDLVLAETVTRQRRILAGRLTPEEYRWESGWVAGAMSALEAPDKLMDKLATLRERIEENSPTERDDDA